MVFKGTTGIVCDGIGRKESEQTRGRQQKRNSVISELSPTFTYQTFVLLRYLWLKV